MRVKTMYYSFLIVLTMLDPMESTFALLLTSLVLISVAIYLIPTFVCSLSGL